MNAPYIYRDGSPNGLPFRGDPPILRNGDSPRNRPVKRTQTKARVFSTADDTDMSKYAAVFDMCSLGWATVTAEEREYDAGGFWRIFLRWHEHYYTMPEDGSSRDEGKEPGDDGQEG
jgi:hypothetical protein